MSELTMLAFHNDPKIKDKYVKRVAMHREADQLVKGRYWEKGKGCAVGCTIHSSNHLAYEEELGIPVILARLEDGIFEGLSKELSQQWPERFLNAIKVGADLSLVWPKFAVWLLGDAQDGVIRFCKTKQQNKSIQDIVNAYKNVVAGKSKKVDWGKLRAAAYAADAAAYAADAAAYAADAYAAYAAAYAAAAYAADAAADAAAYAAYAAAYAAADAAAYAAAAKSQVRIKQADKLIELLEECKSTSKEAIPEEKDAEVKP